MMEVSMDASYNGSHAVGVLANLIARRKSVLHETTRDATVATAITVLQSIRAATRRHKGGASIRSGR